MRYLYDNFGWYTQSVDTDEVLPNSSSIAPPTGLAEGHRANYTGNEWIDMEYTPPIPEMPIYIPEPQVYVELTEEQLAINHSKIPKPQVVTMRQAQLALLGAGLFDGIMPIINAIADPTEKQAALIEWTTAKEVQRTSTFLSKMQAALGKTDAEIDTLFEIASNIPD